MSDKQPPLASSRRATYDELLRLALERGFFFPSAEIYNDAPAGFWEYGPTGLLMKNNFVRQWRRELVRRDDMLEIDGSLILPKIVFEASGHLSSLVDPIVQCTRCESRLRADRYITEKTGMQIDERLPPEEFQKLIAENNLHCPKCGGDFGKPTKFNMMFRVGVGAEDADAYLRPETAQSIFVDFSRLSKTMRIKLPKGIAQVGKSFRNEIAPRQALIRLRELTQAEVEVFFNPDSKYDDAKFQKIASVQMNILSQPYGDDQKAEKYSAAEAVRIFDGQEIITYYFALLQEFYESCGFPKEETRFRELSASDRAFYTSSAFDFEVKTSIGWLELVACNYRTDYDLGGHSKFSKNDLSIMDQDEKVLPHVIELSLGVDRSLFALLDLKFFHEEKRDVLRVSTSISPYLVGIFPLISKFDFEKKALLIYEGLKNEDFNSFYDDSGAIGRRYRRMDEIGTPYCVTVDHETLQSDTVTVRERDSMTQFRVKIADLSRILRELRDKSGISSY